MALDFHRLDDNEYLFGLDDRKYDNLSAIFAVYKKSTGIFIDKYSDARLTVENQKALIKMIDTYVGKTDLNADKQKTVDILEFRTLITFFSDRNTDLEIFCD